MNTALTGFGGREWFYSINIVCAYITYEITFIAILSNFFYNDWRCCKASYI